MRIFRTRRNQQTAQHNKDNQEQAEHKARNRRLPADDVRLAPQACQPDIRRGEAAFPGACVQDGDTAKRETERKPEPRTASHPLRRRLDRKQEPPCAGKRDYQQEQINPIIIS